MQPRCFGLPGTLASWIRWIWHYNISNTREILSVWIAASVVRGSSHLALWSNHDDILWQQFHPSGIGILGGVIISEGKSCHCHLHCWSDWQILEVLCAPNSLRLYWLDERSRMLFYFCIGMCCYYENYYKYLVRPDMWIGLLLFWMLIC